MDKKLIRKELYGFYLHGDAERAKKFSDQCFAVMDKRCTNKMTVTEQKLLQYDVIAEKFVPVLFSHIPFYYETGVLTSLSDGARLVKGHSFTHANGWVYKRNEHLFVDQDPELYRRRCKHIDENLYLICGPYNDTFQHFNFNFRPILKGGLRSIYDKAQKELETAANDSEREFLYSVCHGMLCLRKMAEKFAEKAEEELQSQTDETISENLKLIAKTARRVPWEAPATLYEALTTLAFIRSAVGSIEGIGINTFGRLDKDLISFYRSDIEKGILTSHDAYELISLFLLIWDCHYDHDMLMEGYADHELENTYTLGGCEDDGKPLYNEITEMFLRATREEKIIFPKIKCRFSSDSPKEYLDEINRSIVKGTTVVLLQNDTPTVASLIRAGRPLNEARDYMIAGCWDLVTNQEKSDHGSYLNLLKPFEYSIHNMTEKMNEVGIKFECLDGSRDFEEIYQKTLRNCEKIIEAKLDVTRKGGSIFHKVDRLPIFSSTLENCIDSHADYTMHGAKYYDDYQLMFGFPNIIDSLLAIKELVYDEKKYTLDEFFGAVRANWEGYEAIRLDAVGCHGWGDGSEESCTLANRFNNDLYNICQKQTGTYGGKVHMGHLTYTEIRWWGEKTLATPDGRKNGEYFAQGLTPSRLKHIPCVNDVINSVSCLDGSVMCANSVVNIILPKNISLGRCEGFLRAIVGTAVQSLQLNCTSKEELLDAQKHPEKYPDLIVRVTGFSAKFTSLSPAWQEEVITRNFYE